MSDRFIRWQGYAISQLTFTLNMFFGLAVGGLAFSISILRDKEFVLTGCPKNIFLVSLMSLSVCVLVSCAAIVSRLFDFRYTASKIRSDDKAETEQSGLYKHKSSLLGRITWRLFWAQVITLSIGLVCMVVGVLSGYGAKIW
ncbi:hypothetical protein [Teredinibacter franksiae]|uniref:hypothetical protein n=1 Tax=Teredinibacter franksiae TaxID=2761453 RepID=UPI0016267F7D|nr:hypothetical protein [Teredinibacter franksiae]